MHSMKMVADDIPGYAYGTSEVGVSPVSLRELEDLKISAGFAEEDQRYLRLAGEILADQTKQLIDHWRNRIIAGIPNLARHTRTPDGSLILKYAANSGLRFQQWILDTCQRTYDQDWLNYQHEIALRHTSWKKNQVDGVQSTAYVPLRDVIAFVPVMNQTLLPYLSGKGHSIEEVNKIHRAWCKSMHLQLALWARTYMGASQVPNEW
jgi:hypothetical protein